MQPLISIIVAMAKNRVIGRDNQLPWHLPADLKHFKQLTTGHPIIMGRKTYESIGKPLPNRTNIIMSKHAYSANSCITVQTVDEVLQLPIVANCKEIFIIGGATIYQLWLPFTKRIYLTVVQENFTGDTYFPLINPSEWQQVGQESHQADEANHYAYDFLVLER